ncbi:MAG: hypothetical protein ISR61_03590 [Desulfobacteraceae bacterium]|uniref:Uncharacterized protein n=1 Tax=Candidatus Desulfacyla euxinica TaxID=2841693 RepID=A0A8J6T772_9DELT|nr:hypothetical protein [Candidatus Desulfacyla euxinica]MBL6978006.1 hypothetical protein [Desulfobacteraceae bacterium]
MKSPNNLQPTAKYRNKGITVDYGFNCGDIPIKISAETEWWFQFQTNKSFNSLTFETIKDKLAKGRWTSQKNRTKLAEYAEGSPDEFQDDFFRCVMATNPVNPLYRVMPRGRLVHDATTVEIQQIRQASRELYVWLKSSLKQRRWKPVVEKLFKDYGLPLFDDYNNDRPSRRKLKETVQEIIEKHYLKINIDDQTTEDFYKTYIAHAPLTPLKNDPRVISGNTRLIKQFRFRYCII